MSGVTGSIRILPSSVLSSRADRWVRRSRTACIVIIRSASHSLGGVENTSCRLRQSAAAAPFGVVARFNHGTDEDYALPSANILFSTVHPTIALRCCASNPLARRLPPRVRVYRWKVPSTRACCR